MYDRCLIFGHHSGVHTTDHGVVSMSTSIVVSPTDCRRRNPVEIEHRTSSDANAELDAWVCDDSWRRRRLVAQTFVQMRSERADELCWTRLVDSESRHKSMECYLAIFVFFSKLHPSEPAQ
jgi:hypothetical protein